jgi:hypothetical protein
VTGEGENSAEFVDKFIQIVFDIGTDQAIDMLW